MKDKIAQIKTVFKNIYGDQMVITNDEILRAAKDKRYEKVKKFLMDNMSSIEEANAIIKHLSKAKK
jgi:hypothetical protein